MQLNLNKKPILRYPYTAFTEKTDYLQIDVIEYTAIKATNRAKIIKDVEVTSDDGKSTNLSTTSLSAGAGGIRQNSKKASKATILLPIPSSISDSNSVSYQSSDLNSIAGAAVGGVMDIMKSPRGAKDFGDGVNRLLGTGLSTIDALKKSIGGAEGLTDFATRYLASKAVNVAGINITPAQILARSEGKILNPNMELLFNGPGLRTFRFQFKLTPRGPKEANEVKDIIRTFKYHMAPKVDISKPFLKTPNIFELRYRKGALAHPFLHRFKQCFLSSVNVNYTGEGNYTTYENGTPVSMIMDLTFEELEPIYNTDYKGYTGDGPPGPDSAVGGVGY